MKFGIGSLRTGIFNVADIAAAVGGRRLLVDAMKRPQVVSAVRKGRASTR